MARRMSFSSARLRVFCMLLGSVAAFAGAAERHMPGHEAVAAVGDQRIEVRTAAGSGTFVFYASRPLTAGAAQPDIERAVLVMHGVRRDADVYFETAQAAARDVPAASARALLIAPQFLAERDVRAHSLPPEILRWDAAGWEGGDAAAAPAPVSSFDALDALLAMLADRARFPKLAQVVIAGHSGGGQVVQRYAVVGQGESRLAAVGVKVRYVVANPSSYLYFSAERPQAGGRFGVPPDAAACSGFDRWKYGWGGAPPYARQASPVSYETRYLRRDVIYLLGGADTDPAHPALDRTCAAESQGAYRLARGRNYAAYLRSRDPGLRPIVEEVSGVGHDGKRMFTSACGLAALFDDPSAAAACAR